MAVANRQKKDDDNIVKMSQEAAAQQYTPTNTKKTQTVNVLSKSITNKDLNTLRNGISPYKQGSNVTKAQKNLNNVGKQPTYKQDKSVNAALKNLNNLQRPGEYSSAYTDRINNLLNQMENDNGYTYFPEKDPLYQSYRDQYTRLGRRAMEDTIGNAAALTGGYGNTYAQSAGQQSYQDYLSQANDRLLDLYDRGYQNYRDQVGDRQQLLSNYQGLDESDYGRYMDTWDQYNTDRNYLYNYYTDARDTDYNRYRDKVGDWNTNRNFLQQQLENERNYDLDVYDRSRDNWQDRLDLTKLQLSNQEQTNTNGGGGGNNDGNNNDGNSNGSNNNTRKTESQNGNSKKKNQLGNSGSKLLDLKKKLGLLRSD